MSKVTICFSIAVSVIFLTCCTNYKVGKEMRRFVESEIVVSQDLECVADRNISTGNMPDSSSVLVMYYDSTECSGCRINHLMDLKPLYELSDSLGSFEVMTVFSPRQEEYDEVVRQLMVLDFPYPVYVDYAGEFRKANTCIPDDKRFHSFLVDRDGHPVFVGNPLASDGLWELFIKSIKSLSEK